MAGRGSIAWVGRHGVCCLLRYWHRLRIWGWGRRHGQDGLAEKRGRVRLSRLSGSDPELVSDMVRESGEQKSPRFSERVRKCGSRKLEET